MIRETTSGSNKAEFNYKAARVKLAKPLVRVINGTEIINRFKVTVEAMKNTKDVAKKSKSIKCNKIPKDGWFGGADVGRETGAENGVSEPVAENGVSEHVSQLTTDNTDNPFEKSDQDGGKKLKYKKMPSKATYKKKQ